MATIVEKRRCGNTTRIVDELVQNFFEKGECHCYDHFHSDIITRANLRKRVMVLVADRLRREHHLLINKHIRVDQQHCILFNIIKEQK